MDEVETTAPAVETTSTEASAPAAAPAATTPSAVTGAGASAPAPVTFPTHDSFGWDKWDGSHQSLPEPVRGWGERLEGHYTKEAQAREAEAKELRELYERLTTDSEDPRVGQTKAELEAAKAEYAREKAEYEEKLGKYQAWEAELQQITAAESAKFVEEYKAANAWIWDGGPIEKLANELVDEEFAPSDLPTILRLPPALIAEARRINKDLVAGGTKGAGTLALRIARSEAKFAAAPSESLQASPANRITTPTTTNPGTPTSFEERRQRAVDAANRAMKAG